MKVRKFAAIDIGSNAIRLLTHNVIEEEGKKTLFRKSALVRLPIRLGEDVFVNGRISDRNTDRLVNAMKAFQLLMKVHGVEKYMACATSAMREAANGEEVIAGIFDASGVNIEIIDGEKEASIIASTDLKNVIKKDENYLYIDVGGGSTEFTVFTEGEIKISQSFKIGTVRLLNDMVDEGLWKELELWLKNNVKGLANLSIIGSGGNINKLHKMSGRKLGDPLSYVWLKGQYHFLQSLTFEERVSELGLNPDRADVIIHATRIFINAAKWLGVKKIHVPKIGLSDGIIKTLYYTEN
ncbi:exopolyphosphatase / guanosine-5'-triphosphate,3'-diphosphate pyrophosphatase [Arenibacter nanhaiticus]|uniref:Exopolyphosphatase / guanosine-5'-triphosphate,3'-diphosphate pyrophosphatase n=1 Tax=Arenibacter nanhaiticus TaxID=558155 RepID=A0A1M6B4J8_9FLAO|nr:exopolyphosphatase [Arenibacter nanhaiticus]SHI43625.1 exopolyphosphatase / guanosine-5'-triphosphate,3'-diphosphate pyrophosphatase [Arenibacter nanhaiticus]